MGGTDRRGFLKHSLVAAGVLGLVAWSHACFSADGQWMFANLYSPGMTFAITGPWLV
jgi:hypothetical protein